VDALIIEVTWPGLIDLASAMRYSYADLFIVVVVFVTQYHLSALSLITKNSTLSLALSSTCQSDGGSLCASAP